MFGLLTNMTSRYAPWESRVYDAVIAPAVVRFMSALPYDLVTELPRDARVLDVGCGGGQVLATLAERRPDLRLVGLDLSNEQIRRARKRTSRFGVELRQGSALELPFDDESFDAVYSCASIKHWPDPALGLSECVRVLRPDGRVAIVETDRGCHLPDAARFVGQWRLPPPLRPLALAMFRTWVAGQSPDLAEAEAMLDALPLSERSVQRITGTPALLMLGVKGDASSVIPSSTTDLP